MTTVSLTLRLPRPMHKAIRELAEREQSSINRETLIALRAHLDANYRQGKK